MDLLVGISAIGQAIGLLKDLREIDRGVDESSFRLKIAEIQTSLADAKIALSDARITIQDLEQKVSILTTGDFCPVCRLGRLKVASVEPNMHSNHEFHKCVCDNQPCEYKTTRVYNPSVGAYGERAR